ncbi:MAG: Integrase core domain protein [Candidatus Accumulibacter sp. SK-11]|nr:MAG: Integrase core domain protein [Candidatus Accumulibacter sp. SK-11]
MLMPPSQVQLPIVLQLAAELPTLPHGQSTPRVRSVAGTIGVSAQTLWRWLHEMGHGGERKRRSDSGQLKALSDADVRQMAAIRFAGARETGKVLPTIRMVRDIHNANAPADPQTGAVRTTTAHPSTIARAMRRIGCHTDQLMQQAPAQALRSLHPNHVWQVDVSTCVLFYLANGGVEVCDEAAFNKNKPSNFERVQQLRVQRYLAVDHCSGAFHLHYLSGHETSRNLLDFLILAFHQRECLPFYGVPKLLVVDPGSAQASGIVRSLARALDIEVLVHRAHNPRAKGAVETMHAHIERQFEGRLHATRVADFDALNALAATWSRAYQSTAMHGRHGQTRFAAWQRIRPEELRLAPGADITRALVMTTPVQRTVNDLLQISFACPGYGRRAYSVAGVPGAAVGEKLYAVASPYALPSIDILVSDASGREVRHRVSPLRTDDFGFDLDAPVIGERFQAPADTWIDTERKTARRAAWGTDDDLEIGKVRRGKGGERGVAFGGAVDAFADVRSVPVPAFLPRSGTPIAVDRPAADESLMSATTACLRMAALLGEENWLPEHYAWITQRFAEGISEPQFTRLAEQWQAQLAGADAAGERRAC